MELRQVRYFIALSETLNFTRAAEQCNVAQPTLTLAIKKLEEELGGPLVHRERANTHLTSLGRMLLPILQQVTDSCDAAQLLAEEISRGDRLPLRIGVSCCVNPAHLIAPIRKIASEEMGLELTFCRDREPVLLQQLLDGDLELLLGGIDMLDEAKLRVRQIYRESMRVALSADHKLAQKAAFLIEDLSAEPWIGLTGSQAHKQFAGSMLRHAPEWTEQHTTSRAEDVLFLCRAGVGISLVGQHEVLPSGVVERPLVDPMIERSVGLVEVRGRPLGKVALSFSRMLQAISMV